MMNKLFFLLAVIVGFVGNTIAQEITGRVFDSNTHEPLLGVSIIAGTTGVVSDLDGNFTIELYQGVQQIDFSYVGYAQQSVSVTDIQDGTISVYMKEANTFLETAIVTGSRYEKNISDSPVSISILKPDLIESTNTQAIDDVLDKLPGVQMIDGQANIRGGSGYSYGAGSRVLLLVDDLPALQGDAGRPSWGDIPVENISQIEVLKGASSSLYGSAALNGIINIRTGYATAEPETHFYTSYVYFMNPTDINKKWWGSENDPQGDLGLIKYPKSYSASILHKRKIKKVDLVFNSFYYNEDSYLENGYNERARFSVNSRYRLSDRLTLSLNTMFNIGRAGDFFLWSDGGGGAYKSLAGSFSEREHQRYYIDPSITYYDRSNNKHRFIGRYYFINNDNSNNQANTSDTYYAEYQFLKSWEPIGLTFTSGVSTLLITSDSELFSDTLTNSNNYALYAQVEKALSDELDITLGWRIERNTLKGPKEIDGLVFSDTEFNESKSVFRAGLNYKLAEYSYLRASWGQGYRFPTITEKYIRTTFSNLAIYPNPELTSEFGWSTEIGIRQGFRVFGYEGFLDIAPFWSRYKNMTEFSAVSIDGNVGFQSQNVGDVDIKGIEFNLGGQSSLFSIPVRIIGGYTYIEPTYVDFTEVIQDSSSSDENILKYRTKHNWKIDVESELLKGLKLGVSVNRTSHMVAVDQLLEGFGSIGSYRNLNNTGFYKTDVRVSYLYEAYKLSLVLNNALNEEYTLRPGFLEGPRNLAVRFDLDI